MNLIWIELFAMILSTMILLPCTAKLQLNELVDLLNNSQTNCSEFLVTNGSQETPIYIHPTFTNLSKIITNRTLSVFYNRTVSFIEQFLRFFDHYFTKITNGSEKSAVETIRYLLSGLHKLHQSIASIGFCFNDKLYHSNSTKTSDYLCKKDVPHTAPNGTAYGKTVNDNIRQLKWEPAVCMNDGNPIKFPIRLVYSIRLSLATKPSIIYFEFSIMDFKLDQCAHDLHKCQDTTECIYHLFPENQMFSIGNYYCNCKKGYYVDQRGVSPKGFPGKDVENVYRIKSSANKEMDYFRYFCQRCKTGCDTCTTGESCVVSYETTLFRVLPLAIQSFCITICIVTGIIIFQLRRTRVVKSSNWILLEFFLLGAILIYCTIINSYFVPSEMTCAIQPFLREGGFVLMYGVLYVKVYRVLCSFQSRKAQRVYVRDQDILRYLGVLVIICMGHLIAWLATGFDHKQNNLINTFSDTKKLSKDLNYLTSKVCRSRFWEIVSCLYETGLLALTIYYCKCVKSAPSEYGEVRFITIAVINELIISLLIIITRLTIVDNVHPDYIFFIYFIHCHATATISVLLVIGPKMWYVYRPPATSSCKPRLVPHTESHIIQTQQKLNGDVDLVEINLAEMDCETIRDELKRLYTQLEIYKTRAMRKDNPHVNRKRGGRKQRRFSLQHFHKKHHATSVHDDETSKISEDSAGNSGGEEATLTSTSNK